MTEFNIEYRGFEVPTKFLGGLFGVNSLAAWKEGIDTALAAGNGSIEDIPEQPAVRYAVDRDGWYFRAEGSDVGYSTPGYRSEIRELPTMESFDDLLENWYYDIEEVPESDVPAVILGVFNR
jgi:hypothetical protein